MGKKKSRQAAAKTPFAKLLGFIQDEREHRGAFLSEPRRSDAIAEANEAEQIALALFASREHLRQDDPPAPGTYLVKIQRPDGHWEPDVCQWEPKGRRWTSTNKGIVVYWHPKMQTDQPYWMPLPDMTVDIQKSLFD